MAVLADFLTNSAARQALSRRDIADVYRILRDVGVSQADIAVATGQKQSEISEIISGRQVQSVALLERIADGLGVPRGWLGLAYVPDTAPATQHDSETDDLSDNNLLRHAATVLRGKPVFGPAEPIHVRATPTPLPRRVGLAEVKQVAATTQRLDGLVGDFGGIPMTGALTAHARVSEALLSADMRESVRTQLLVALSDAHRVAGGAAASAGLCDLARQHFVRGMDCAGEAGEMLRAVFALDSLGRLELGVGQPDEALKLFQLGAASARSALARSRLEYDCAWAFGLLGEAREAIAALRRADDSHQTASDEPRPWEHFATSLLGPAKPARSSQVCCVRSSGEASGSREFIDGVVVGAGGGAEFGGHGWAVDLGEAGAEQSGVGSGEEQRLAQSGVGDTVAVGFRDALDESVDAEPA